MSRVEGAVIVRRPDLAKAHGMLEPAVNANYVKTLQSYFEIFKIFLFPSRYDTAVPIKKAHEGYNGHLPSRHNQNSVVSTKPCRYDLTCFDVPERGVCVFSQTNTMTANTSFKAIITTRFCTELTQNRACRRLCDRRMMIAGQDLSEVRKNRRFIDAVRDDDPAAAR